MTPIHFRQWVHRAGLRAVIDPAEDAGGRSNQLISTG